jgi:hypothetical protein
LFPALPYLASAQTVSIYRSGSLTSPGYSSIDAALDKAIDGDSLVLSPDLFNESILLVSKKISFTGTYGSSGSRTIIDGSGRNGPLFFVTGTATAPVKITFKDIEFRNGTFIMAGGKGSSDMTESGGAIYADSYTNLYFRGHCRIHDNVAKAFVPRGTSSGAYPGKGGAIYSKGNISLEDSTEVYNNKALNGCAIYCLGDLVMKQYALVRNNQPDTLEQEAVVAQNADLSDFSAIRNNLGDGITVSRTLSMKGQTEIAGNKRNGVSLAGMIIARNNARIHHNGGYGAHSESASINNQASIDSNKQYGLILTGLTSFLSTLNDSARVWANGMGGIRADVPLAIRGQASVCYNTGKSFGGLDLSDQIWISDSAIIGFNTSIDKQAAGIFLSRGNLHMNGGQIIGNRCITDSVRGMGMAITLADASADIRNARIFNPNGDTMQQNEILLLDTMSSFSSDTTWWGDSDTAGIFSYPRPAKFRLNSRVVTQWSLNGGLPLSGSSAPLNAHFTLNSGAALPPKQFWMLAAWYRADSGSFTPPLAFMDAGNDIQTLYSAPATTRSNKLLGIIDADSFQTNALLSGTRISESKLSNNRLQLYPNPAREVLQINSAEAITRIRIFDLNGRMIQGFEKPAMQIALNLHAGTYLLEADFTDGQTERQMLSVW